MNNFGNNLSKYRRRAGISQQRLAERLNLKQQTVASWEAGRTAPGPNIIYQLSRLLNITADQLLSPVSSLKCDTSFACIPIVSSVKAGFSGYSTGEILGSQRIELPGDDAEYVLLMVEGDSMEPLICAGDLALVRIQDDLQSGDIGIVIVDNNLGSIKKVIKQPGGIILQPFNSNYPSRLFLESDASRIRIYGKVIKTIRKW